LRPVIVSGEVINPLASDVHVVPLNEY
jgi:hypothetical protein